MDKPRLVSDIMSRKVVVLQEEDNLEQLEQGMEQFKFRHLPVVDGNRFLGLVSQRDLLAIASSRLMSRHASVDVERKKEGTFVVQVMQSDVKTVRPETTLVDAGKLLVEHKVGCLPVVDDKGELVGIVTAHDFLRLAVKYLEQE